jgi:DnaK suppressor protein
MAHKESIDVAAFKARLLTERQDLLHDAEVTAGERAPVILDQTTVGRLSRMDALQNQAMQIEAERRREVELTRIDAALKRMDAGKYGVCVSCGEMIGHKRLDADPATPLCVHCASDH